MLFFAIYFLIFFPRFSIFSMFFSLFFRISFFALCWFFFWIFSINSYDLFSLTDFEINVNYIIILIDNIQMTIVLDLKLLFFCEMNFKPLIHRSRIDLIIYYQRPWDDVNRFKNNIVDFVRCCCTFRFQVITLFSMFLTFSAKWLTPKIKTQIKLSHQNISSNHNK